MAKTHEQQIAEYDAQIERIKARRHAAVMRQSKAERKARNHALIVAGGLLMACFDGGWQSVDWPGLAALVDSNSNVFAQRATEPLPTTEAMRRLREWENLTRKGGDHNER